MDKIIKGHHDYSITEQGEVISFKGRQPRMLIPDTSTAYPRVNLDGRKYYIANLVAEHFLKKPNPDYRIFYIDGDTENCQVDNLVYLTSSDIQRFSKYTVEYRKQVLAERARD